MQLRELTAGELHRPGLTTAIGRRTGVADGGASGEDANVRSV
jgi:hypothetical protein